MKESKNIEFQLPEDLKKCIEFHGHLCPGLIYGYMVAKSSHGSSQTQPIKG